MSKSWRTARGGKIILEGRRLCLFFFFFFFTQALQPLPPTNNFCLYFPPFSIAFCWRNCHNFATNERKNYHQRLDDRPRLKGDKTKIIYICLYVRLFLSHLSTLGLSATLAVQLKYSFLLQSTKEKILILELARITKYDKMLYNNGCVVFVPLKYTYAKLV